MQKQIPLHYDLVLASRSPRRREILEQIGIRYKVVDVNVVEQREPKETAADYVIRLARWKSAAGARQISDCPSLGADTIVVCEGDVLEKPKDEEHARHMLECLSARTHTVMTAVAITFSGRREVLLNQTEVEFGPISELEIKRYWLTGEPRDKAGGYGIQGFGGVFVKNIRGSYSSVVGLPLYETQQLLHKFDVPFWCSKTNHE